MIIVVDIRETDLFTELQPYATENLKIITHPLDIGDIHFTEDLSGSLPYLVLERKTAADMGASQKDGRYREQRARLQALREGGTKIGYLVEAPAWSPTLSRTWCQGTFNEVHLQTAITRLQLRYNIPVFHATTMKETIQWIRRFVASIQADPTVFKTGLATTAEEASKVYSESIHVKKAANNSPERIFTSLLLVLPGVGPAAAAAIGVAVEHKVSNLLQKTEDELAAINTGKKKVGKTTAAIIYKTFHEI
jgi:ERCC4-type nuclease